MILLSPDANQANFKHMADTVCSIPLFFCFLCSSGAWNAIFQHVSKFGRNLAGTGVYQKDLRVLGAKVGRLSVQRMISECFFVPRIPLLIAGYTTLEWR